MRACVCVHVRTSVRVNTCMYMCLCVYMLACMSHSVLSIYMDVNPSVVISQRACTCACMCVLQCMREMCIIIMSVCVHACL